MENKLKEKAKNRLLEKIFICNKTGCWLWTRYIAKNGYANFWYSGQTAHAHRISYIIFNGEYNKNLFEIDHICNVKHCINPNHLRIVSHKENMARLLGTHRKRTHCPNGHLYDEKNSGYYEYSLGRKWRYCKKCRVIYIRKKRLIEKQKNA